DPHDVFHLHDPFDDKHDDLDLVHHLDDDAPYDVHNDAAADHDHHLLLHLHDALDVLHLHDSFDDKHDDLDLVHHLDDDAPYDIHNDAAADHDHHVLLHLHDALDVLHLHDSFDDKHDDLDLADHDRGAGLHDGKPVRRRQFVHGRLVRPRNGMHARRAPRRRAVRRRPPVRHGPAARDGGLSGTRRRPDWRRRGGGLSGRDGDHPVVSDTARSLGPPR